MIPNRDEYAATMKRQLDLLNARIDTLEARAHEAKLEMREAYQTELKAARHQSTLAMAKLAELRTAGADSWDFMVAEMDKLRDAFTHSFKNFKSRL